MSNGSPRCVVVRSPANIALIKYWGKKDTVDLLPLNDSISLTIDAIYARTRLTILTSGSDSVTINGKTVEVTPSSRFASVFSLCRRYARKRHHPDESGTVNGDTHAVHFFIQVDSTTNFPVGAGLASSAAGFAAIALGLGKLFGLSDAEVSALARTGSGSACRSVFGGLVQWKCGEDASSSVSKCIFPFSHWPSLRAIILILDNAEKSVGSTPGMQRTVDTSTLLEHRLQILPKRIQRLTDAFSQRDFPSLAVEIMKDSNQLHALCMDTYPPLKYMNDDSWRIVDAVHCFNKDEVKVAYTFDAGPNACLYMEKEQVSPFLFFLSQYVKFTEDLKKAALSACDGEFEETLKDWDLSTSVGTIPIQGMIVSTVGGGPTIEENGVL